MNLICYQNYFMNKNYKFMIKIKILEIFTMFFTLLLFNSSYNMLIQGLKPYNDH